MLRPRSRRPELPDPHRSPSRARPGGAAGLLLVLLLGLGAAPASGQGRPPAETITPDRPGLGDGAHVVGSGVWQVEAGLAWSAGGGADVFSIGQGLVRYGTGPIELRLYPNSFLVSRGGGPDEEGLEDLGLGIKIPLGTEESVVASAVAGITLPTGADAFTADDNTAWATIVFEADLAASATLGFNVGYAFPFESAGDGTFALIVTPAFPVNAVEGMSAYVGWAGFFRDGDDTQVLEGGVARAIGADYQWDVNAGIDVDTGDGFLGIGLARRWR